MTQEGHETCKYDAMRTLQKISFLNQHLKDMKIDNCESMSRIHMESLNAVDAIVLNIRQRLMETK